MKRERNELDKKPFWYLFFAANLIIVIGVAITFSLIYRNENISNNILLIPTIICNILAVVPAGFFIWFEMKDISPKAMHFQRKWLKFYVIAGAFFVLAICFNSIFFIFCNTNSYTDPTSSKKWVWIIYLVITIVLTLISVGFQRYARFRIDLDVYRRKHGEEIKQKEDLAKEKAKKKQVETKVDEPTTSSTANEPSGGLLDQMDK